MKKIKAALIIMVWMILMMFFLPVSLVGGISAKIGERINKGFRRYLDNVFGGLE
jgi:ABC-type Na+ efflux pump permease subunit